MARHQQVLLSALEELFSLIHQKGYIKPKLHKQMRTSSYKDRCDKVLSLKLGENLSDLSSPFYLVHYIARALKNPWRKDTKINRDIKKSGLGAEEGWTQTLNRIQIMKQLLTNDFWVPDLGFFKTRHLHFLDDEITLMGGLYTWRECDTIIPCPNTVIQQIRELLVSYNQKKHNHKSSDKVISEYKSQFSNRSTLPKADPSSSYAAECLRMIIVLNHRYIDTKQVVADLDILTPGILKEIEQLQQGHSESQKILRTLADVQSKRNEQMQDLNDREDMRWE